MGASTNCFGEGVGDGLQADSRRSAGRSQFAKPAIPAPGQQPPNVQGIIVIIMMVVVAPLD
jgi:hypothetical protein